MARIPNQIFLTMASSFLSLFIFTALDASLIITELSAIIIFTTQLATLWHSIKQSKYSTIWRTQCRADSISVLA